MLKTKKSKIISLTIFLLIQAVFLLLVVITGDGNFSVVVISALFVTLSFSKTRSYLFTQIALVTTVCADIFLVVIEPMIQLPAMIFFSITQISYFLRIFFETNNKLERKIHLIIRVLLSVLILIVTLAVLRQNTDALSLVSMFYYTNLVLNVVFAFIHFKKSPFFAIGLLLFFFCDTIIGFDIMADDYLTGSLVEWVNNIFKGANWAWIFYVPSQALIATSLIKFNKKKSST